MEKRAIQDLVKRCAGGLFDLACAVSGRSDWDLNLPVGVIDARFGTPRLTVTAVGTINSVLKASAVIGTPLMRRFFDRFSTVGLEQAHEEFSSGEDAEAFGELWETYLDERRSGGQAMWSVEDATAFVMHNRAGHVSFLRQSRGGIGSTPCISPNAIAMNRTSCPHKSERRNHAPRALPPHPFLTSVSVNGR